MFKPDHCSPGNDNNISCIELPLLKKIAKILNQQPECSPININSKQQLYNQIKKEMNKISDCDSESCWILEDKIKNNLSKLLFVITSNSLNFLSLISESFCRVYFINDGSFFFPLIGTGARNGLSVSINNFSLGIVLRIETK